MSTDQINSWVLPSSIPFESLKGHDLEECIYWLMDSLGAKDLEWRVGGSGGGAADGGRDLEARFFTPTPDGEMAGQRWWIECKGRSGTVEPDAVKSACMNAGAQKDLAYLVIATNTTFSNPTIDWVKEWQSKHPLPKVKLWDRSALERMLSKHPNAVFRLFSHALSTTGHMEVAREGFWNRFDYAAPKALKTFWAARDQLQIGPLERIALIVSEFAQGRIGDRPWGVAGTPQDTLEALGLAIANLPYLFGRALRSGIESEPIVRSIAYLILSALRVVPAETVGEVIDAHFRVGDGEDMPPEIRKSLFDPVINTLVYEVQEVCTSDCKRFIAGGGDDLAFDNEPVNGYWARLQPAGRPAVEADDKPKLWIQKNDAPCKVGFPMDKGRGCPLFEDEVDDASLRELLPIIERIVDFRSAPSTETAE